MGGKPGTGLHVVCPHCDGTGKLPMERCTVGTMILAQRKKSGMTQQDLAQKVMLSRGQVANIEGGRTDIPTERLMLFAQAFGCSPKDLIPG